MAPYLVKTEPETPIALRQVGAKPEPIGMSKFTD